MSKTEIRINSLLTFDTEKEADVIEFIQDLTSQHKLGRMIAYLLRLACETPEVLENREKLIPILQQMQDLNVTPKRNKMYQEYAKLLLEMKQKINDIYNMTEKLYTLALANKALGLEDRSKELLAAQFVLKHQTDVIERKIGADALNFMYDSATMQNALDRANEVMQTLIETHGEVFNELKTAMADAKSLKLDSISVDKLNIAGLGEINLETLRAITNATGAGTAGTGATGGATSGETGKAVDNKADTGEETAVDPDEPLDFELNDDLMTMLGE